MEKVVIVSGVRTPIGAYGGTLKDLHVTKYAGLALNEAVKRAKIEPDRVDDVIMGQSYQNGECANGSRMALLDAGWPEKVPVMAWRPSAAEVGKASARLWKRFNEVQWRGVI